MSFGLEVWNGSSLVRIDENSNFFTVKASFEVDVYGRSGELKYQVPSAEVGDFVMVTPLGYVTRFSDIINSRYYAVPNSVRGFVRKSGEVTLLRNITREINPQSTLKLNIHRVDVFGGV